MKPFLLRSSILALAVGLAAPAFAQPPQKPAAPPSRPAGERPGDVVVTGTRSDVIATPDRASFSVANDLQVQTGTVADALRAVPGVEVDLQGRVSLRGDPGVTILIDGRPSALLRGDSRGDALLAMPAGQIERVEVITNPSAAMSPEGSGGVINLVTRRVRKDTRSATVRATLGSKASGSLNLTGALSRSGLTATGDLGYRRFRSDTSAVELRSRLDPAGNVVTSRQDSALRNSLSSRTARLSLDYDLDKKNRLSTELGYRDAGGDVSRTDVFAASNPAASFTRLSNLDLFQRGLDGRASWRRTLPGKDHEFLAEAQIELGRLRRELAAETDFAAAPSQFERIRNAGTRHDYTLKLDYKRPLGKDGSLNLGYQGSRTETGLDYLGERGASFGALLPVPGLTNRFDYAQTIHAWYGTWTFDLGKLDVQAGLRLEQADLDMNEVTDAIRIERGYFRAYPTLHLGYAVSKTEQLRASYSRRIQRPSPQDLNPYIFYVDPLSLRRGNPALKPEVTDSFEFAWQHRKGGNFYSLTGFYRRSSGGVTDVLSDLGGGVFLTSRANLATATRAGAELIANGRLTKTLTYNATFTLLWNEIDTRAGGVSAPRSGTSASARANFSWQPTKKDFFQLNAVYNGKQLLPQGYRLSNAVLNFGYRRKMNERLSLLVTAQDLLASACSVILFDTPTLHDKLTTRGAGRTILFGLTYNLGAQNPRNRKDPGFDFQRPAPERGTVRGAMRCRSCLALGISLFRLGRWDGPTAA
jgi:outer membrane receptor protein involved in Fe transport